MVTMKEQFDVSVDTDNIEILEWIRTHFDNGNSHKRFVVTVSLHEFDYKEDGQRVFVIPMEENIIVKYNQ